MSLSGKLDDKCLDSEIAGNEDEEVGAMVRLKSFSVTREASEAELRVSREESETSFPEDNNDTEDSTRPLVTTQISSNSDNAKTPNRYSRIACDNDDGTRPSRVSLQDDPFHKSRVPRKSVLKRTNHPIPRADSTYASTPSSPPLSPTNVCLDPGASDGHASPAQDRKCCSIM